MTLSNFVIFTPMWIKSIPLESPALAEFKYIICFPTAALVFEEITYFLTQRKMFRFFIISQLRGHDIFARYVLIKQVLKHVSGVC